MSHPRLPGCDLSLHSDDVCERVLAEWETPGTLLALVSAEGDKPAEVVVWSGPNSLDVVDMLRTTDPAEAHAFADRLRELAAAVDQGAALLARQEVTA
jgi:hypothetical protein